MIRAVDSKEIPQVADMFIEFMFELKVISGDSYCLYNGVKTLAFRRNL